jgi:signal transduction histidine kinase
MLVLEVDSPRYTIIAMSTKSSRFLGTRVQDVRGHALAEALWLTTSDDGGFDTAALAASLERVIHTGKPDAMPLRRCHITPPSQRRGSESPRWWNVINFPMPGASGRVSHIVQRIEDVTGTAQMQLAQARWLPARANVSSFNLAPRVQASNAASRGNQRDREPETTSSVPALATLPRALRGPEPVMPSLLLATAELDHERLRVRFDELGYRVLWARSEKETLTICAQQRPDCILLDLSLADIGGLRTCRAIRQLPGCADAAILCLSARRDAAALDGALLAGADEILEQPVHSQELLSQVEAALLQQPGMTEPLRSHCQNLRRQRMRLCRLQLHRERVASYIVHDLKEPLSTIDLRAALLLLDTSLPDPTRSSIERIRTQVRSALSQVLNLLDIRMLDEGRLEARYQPVDLSQMVRELLMDFDAKAQARALTLRSQIEVARVIADPDLLRRVLANLLDNAMRHAPKHTEVAVTAHRIAGGRVELRVLDAGATIPPEMTERIFEAFVQVDESGASYRSRTGCGLGLAFCKLAVEAHHGEIAVSNIDSRTVFSIKLPESFRQAGT